MTVHMPDVGRYYEDFQVGDVYKHWPGRTVTETDNIWFTCLTMNSHPVHLDSHYAAGQVFGKPLVNSTLTLAIVAGLSVRDTSQNTVANLGWQEITLPNPVFAGDTLYAESEVVGTRASRSRPEAGIVTIRTTGYNQHNQPVIVYTRSFLAKKRGYDEGRLPAFGVQP